MFTFSTVIKSVEVKNEGSILKVRTTKQDISHLNCGESFTCYTFELDAGPGVITVYAFGYALASDNSGNRVHICREVGELDCDLENWWDAFHKFLSEK